MLNQYQLWTFVSALIVENRIPSTRQSLALSAVDRYCGNHEEEVWATMDNPDIDLDIKRLFCVQSEPDVDRFMQYVLDNR